MTFQSDEQFMRQALEAARQGGLRGEVPIGAVVIGPHGAVMGVACNAVEERLSQAEHAEVRALRLAGERLGTWRLDGCTLYVTLEPCMMCISLAALSRIERIVYGAASPRFGYSLDREGVLSLYTRQIKSITSGVLADEAAQLLRDSFGEARSRP